MIDVPSPTRSHHRHHRPALRRAAAVALALVAGAAFATPQQTAGAVADDDWLGIVNTYRAMSGLAPVAANTTWSAEAEAHSCYMLLNGISHDEVPGRPGYTPGGDLAGNSGNVAVSSAIGADARDHIDLWMTGPFHAIGILRHNLATSAFGLCTNSSTPTWHSGGTLDVIRGLDYSRPRPATPIVFPGDGATVPLHRFVTESPNPMDDCGWSGTAGLPLIAMLPREVSGATSTLTGPSGPIETCTLTGANTSGTASAILAGDNAVVVMPRIDLPDGAYTATVTSDGGNVTWSFEIDRDAELEVEAPDLPDTVVTGSDARFDAMAPFRFIDSRIGKNAVRLVGGRVTEVTIADPDVVAVSANFTATRAGDVGYLTAYNCTSKVPVVSTIGYGPGSVVANQAIVPLDRGRMCLYAHSSTDIVVDVNGYYRAGDGSGFVPVTPARIHDSRTVGRLRAGEERVLQVAGVAGVPSGSVGVALNVTAVQPADDGYLQVYPCGAPTAAQISSLNYGPRQTRANSVVVPVDAAGRVCARSLRSTDLVVDVTGYFADEQGLDFAPLAPIRLFDSRSIFTDLNPVTAGTRVRGGRVVRLAVAGERGIPADARAVSVNLTAVRPVGPTHLTAYPCGSRPLASNVNVTPGQGAAANGAMVKLSGDGDLCIYASGDVHVIVDVNGVWR